MAPHFAKNFSTASKRTRSQHSPAPLESPPASKASKKDETQDDAGIPVFLRQTKAEISAKFRELNWQEKIRIAQGRSDPESKWVQDISLQVTQRNRYNGVQPWDKSRIHLRVAEGDSDYINASPISLVDPRTGKKTAYIATQGPKKNGLCHFWQMIWHETGAVAVVVMLTPTEESGREKCFQYFPLDSHTESFKINLSDAQGGTIEGEVAFVEVSPDTKSNTMVRKLHLTFGSEKKIIWHMLFTAFPDFGVPEDDDRAELLELLKLSAEKNNSPSSPKIIHCSAGVGRSGTFIALEYLLTQLDSGAVAEANEGEDMVHDVVHRLREQRMMMVQMDVQYRFLYEVLREEFEKKRTAAQISGGPSLHSTDLTSAIEAKLLGERGGTKANGDAETGDSGTGQGFGKNEGQAPNAV